MPKLAFEPLESTTVATLIQQRLEAAIYSGELRPGERLIEADLAEAMQVSRASFREALRLLQSKGLVVATHRRGTYVAELTVTDVREIYTLRILLEAYAIRLAAEQADQEIIDRLQSLTEDLREAADRHDHRRIVDLDLDIHRAICTFTGNAHLLDTWTGLIAQVRALLLTKYRLFDDSPDIARGHQQLVDAIRDHDAQRAEALLHAHISDTAEQVLAALNHQMPDA
jgi:DNA-binding GntR family transcriptional regulator